MKLFMLAATVALTALTATPVFSQRVDDKAPVDRVVREFYTAFNSNGFDRAAEFTTDDWNHITPLGGRTRGRVGVLQQLRQVHDTFLRGVTEAIDEMDVRFATSDVAVATVTSSATSFTTPDGVRRENPRQIRTFVLVKRAGHWQIMQDHASYVTAAPPSPANR